MTEPLAARAARLQLRHRASLAALAWADTAPVALAGPSVVTGAPGSRGASIGPMATIAPRAAAKPAPPRDYTAAASLGSSSHGDAQRAATLAARRSFVALKQTYLDATATLHGAESEWLREQVRTAEEPIDLWLLRAPLFASLAGQDPERRRLRQRLRRAIAAMFGEPQPTTAFAVLR